MHSPQRQRPHRTETRASSLVIILAFIVLLTVLVLAYFSYSSGQLQISQANMNQAAVGVFAEGAINTVVGDLRQEIVASSTNISTNTSLYQVYIPKSAATVVPAPSGFAIEPGMENLVKISRSGTSFFPNSSNYNSAEYPPANRAAALSSTAPSLNGRFLTSARWNAPMLVCKSDTTSATDLTPIPAFIAPDWILVARSGTNPKVWDSNMRWHPSRAEAVLGRYAYAIYDEGGLLDLNAAGYPPGSSSNIVAEKGGLAAANLTVIPGVTDKTIAAIIGWRNYVTGSASGNFPTYTFPETTGTYYFNSVRANTSGHLRVQGKKLTDGQSDKMFVSRQQLIQFLTQGVASNDSEKASLQNALQYFTTFSRDLEQPSFSPDPNRPKNVLTPLTSVSTGNGNDAYSVNGATQDMINPALLAVRDTSGDLILKRRFPLSRLALLKPNPATTDKAKIKEYFGLTWNNTNHCWDYDHGDSTRIYRLSEVTGREPDFFEILKAVIHVDSLGKQFAGLDSPATPHGSSGLGAAPRCYDGETQSQIVQIAANIIDQYDGDSYPTQIHFADRNFYGVENLPYLAGWQQMWYHLKKLTAQDIDSAQLPPDANGARGIVFPYESAVVIQPIVWNPHAPDTRSNPPDVPTQFRIRAGAGVDNNIGTADQAATCYPTVGTGWWTDNNMGFFRYRFPASSIYAQANSMTKSGAFYRFPTATVNPATSIITFNTGSGNASFREPFRLRAPNDPTGSNTSCYPEGNLSVSDPALLEADGGSSGPSTIIGFYCGKVWTGPSISRNNTQEWLSLGQLSKDLKLILEYYKDGGWFTYDVIPNLYNQSGNLSTVDNSDVAPNIRTFRTCLRADPRTNRWGLFHLSVWPSSNTSDVPSSLTPLPADGVSSRGNNKAPHYYLPQGITWKPTGNSTYLAQGQANGPSAPGWANPSLWNPADLMVNVYSGTSNSNMGTKTTTPPGAKFYYTDPDGVFRRGSGWNFSGNDGLPLYTGNYNSRPVVLNRPFRSVTELAYAFRDTAWKNVDFFSPESGDTALLDAFCLNELDSAPADITVAGRVNLNTRQPKVLEAVISGVSKAEGGILSATEAQLAATKLVAWTSDTTSATSGILTKGPLRNRSELVGKFIAPVNFSSPPGLTGNQNPILNPEKTYSGFASALISGGVFTNPTDASIPRRAESVLRALVDSGNTRTWNLLVDMVAQVGRYPSGATSLSQFAVEGETRIWVHLAIDRFTGKIIAIQCEQVSE